MIFNRTPFDLRKKLYLKKEVLGTKMQFTAVPNSNYLRKEFKLRQILWEQTSFLDQILNVISCSTFNFKMLIQTIHLLGTGK